MKELVVLSGKGGTGKTSITASFAHLAGASVIADCDVDAADLHLVLSPETLRRETFTSGGEAVIRTEDCIACGICKDKCRFHAVRKVRLKKHAYAYEIDPLACEGCSVCAALCPEDAIDFPERSCGEWMVSKTRFGTMVHARLAIGAENSGKLVTIVKNEARRIARQQQCCWILADGPPGIACPVIASISGASAALIVVEPTLSGIHDMERVLELTRHFGIPAFVCVNKWEIHPAMADEIEQNAGRAGARLVGRIRYDGSVTAAQIRGIPVTEYGGPASEDIRGVWGRVASHMEAVETPERIVV